MTRNPFRSAHAGHVDLATALNDLATAREHVDRLRGQVARRETGAASLAVAEWQLYQALRKVERLQSQADYEPPLDAA